jgi:hypothetical protein
MNVRQLWERFVEDDWERIEGELGTIERVC